MRSTALITFSPTLKIDLWVFLTFVNRNIKKVMSVAGAQHMESGIHKGLVKMKRINSQKHKPNKRNKTLLCKKISKRKIMENRENFKRNFAEVLSLCNKQYEKRKYTFTWDIRALIEDPAQLSFNYI